MAEDDIIEIILNLTEWQVFECKRAKTDPSKMVETIVAFANAEGGTFIIGLADPDKVERKNRLVGIKENLDNVSFLLDIIPKEITPPLPKIFQQRIPIVNVQGEQDELLVLGVDRSTDVHSLKEAILSFDEVDITRS